MITILNAWTQRGWDSCDHLIDDSRLAEVIGRSYASLEHARRAVVARADNRGPVTIEYRSADGRTYRYDGSASYGIPGRHVPMIREVAS